MIRDLISYPAYRDSGVPWLGEVPEHWEVRRLKGVCRLSYGESLPAEARQEGSVPVFGSNGRVGFHSSSNATAPCIVIGRKGSFGKVNFSAGPVFAIDTTFFVDGRFTDADMRWLSYLLGWLRLDEVSKDSAVPGLDREDAYQRLAVLPPRAEQSDMVRFLDHTDRRIRRYIAAKQKLIALLTEQKQAIIHCAVTRGLDPDVRLKSSGVEWLGDVPEHWEVRKLSRLTDPDRKVMYGIVLPGPNVDEGVFIVKGGNCEPGRLRVELLSRTTFQIEAAYARSRLQHGDIVFAIRGGVGAAEMVPPEVEGANLTQDAARIAAGPGVHPGWLLYSVRSPKFRAQVEARVVGATVRGINIRDLKRIDVPVPPPREQTAITEYLDTTLKPIDAGRDRLSREIHLLNEYRTRLIADVVTGKLDVREAAAQLSDQVEEADPLGATDALMEGEESEEDADPDATPDEVVA